MTEREQYLTQIERLVSSQVLHGSESLCKLLRHLAKHALDHPGSAIKEYQIATEVFGRSSDFDPQVDSMVRVQAGRLRAKLSDAEVASRRATILQLIASLELVEIDAVVLDRAAQPMPTELGTIDAIHLATALLWKKGAGVELTMATHDAALGLAAKAHGLPVVGVSAT